MAGEPTRSPKLGFVGWLGRLWLCLADCLLKGVVLNRGWAFGLILVMALGAFEIFNFTTTQFALADLLGDVRFAGLRWASILALAFCGLDFAGLARLFTPSENGRERVEVWYLTGAWFLGATANAVMTWWAVSLILLTRPIGNELLSRDELLTYAPVFIASLVWLTRVCLISTFALSGPRLFSLGGEEAETAAAPVKTEGRPIVMRPLARGESRREKTAPPKPESVVAAQNPFSEN